MSAIRRISASVLFVLSALLCGAFASAISPALALQPGETAPSFSLPSAGGKNVSLSDYKGKVVVLEWFNPDCPFVKKVYRDDYMPKLQADAEKSDVVWLTISSTRKDHPSYFDETGARDIAEKFHMKSKLLVDTSGEVGKMYGAKTTPQLVVVDSSGTIRYSGAFDDAPDTDSDPASSRNYVLSALEAIRDKKEVTPSTTAPYGCSVKY